MAVVQENLRYRSGVMFIQRSLHGRQIDVLAMSNSVAVVVDEAVGLLVDKAGEQVDSIANLVEGQIGEGEYLKLKFLKSN